MNKFDLGYTFITKKEIETRDGVIPKGTLAEINEISQEEHNMDGEAELYKVIFSHEVKVCGYETNATDWLTEQQMIEITR